MSDLCYSKDCRAAICRRIGEPIKIPGLPAGIFQITPKRAPILSAK